MNKNLVNRFLEMSEEEQETVANYELGVENRKRVKIDFPAGVTIKEMIVLLLDVSEEDDLLGAVVESVNFKEGSRLMGVDCKLSANVYKRKDT